MIVQPITYGGRTVAAATAERFFLSDALERRPRDDPERTFVIYMCAYAGDVLRGHLAGPYRDDHARRFARACLIPAELAEWPHLDLERASRELRVPIVDSTLSRTRV